VTALWLALKELVVHSVVIVMVMDVVKWKWWLWAVVGNIFPLLRR
jgi:hypothetical protein